MSDNQYGPYLSPSGMMLSLMKVMHDRDTEIERLRAALEFYAEETRYHIRPPFDRSDIDADYGIRASAALTQEPRTMHRTDSDSLNDTSLPGMVSIAQEPRT